MLLDIGFILAFIVKDWACFNTAVVTEHKSFNLSLALTFCSTSFIF